MCWGEEGGEVCVCVCVLGGRCVWKRKHSFNSLLTNHTEMSLR